MDGQLGEAGVELAFRAHDQQACLLDVHAGEADIQLGLQLVAGQRADLVEHDLPGRDGLLGDAEDALRLQRAEVGDGHLQFDLPLIRAHERVLGYGLQPRDFDLAGRAPEVREQVRGVEADGRAVVGLRRAEGARRADARVGGVGRPDGGEVRIERGKLRGLRLRDGLARRLRPQVSARDARVGAQGNRVGLGEREAVGGVELCGKNDEQAGG